MTDEERKKIEADRRFAMLNSQQQQYLMNNKPKDDGGGTPPKDDGGGTNPPNNIPPTTGGSGGVTYSSFGFSPYQESQAVIDARNAMNAHASNPLAQWTGGSYGAALNQAINKIVNRKDFSYDLNADALYQQYKDRYIGLGKMAMQDTMGQASGMTGGYGNSYASTAGNQAYQGYLQGLNDKVPELYQLALDKYNKEGQDLYNEYAMYNEAYNNEYNQYRDRVNDWNNEYNRLANAYQNAYSQDYGLYSDNYSRALQTAQYNQSVKAANASAKASASSNPAYTPNIDPYLLNGIEAARQRLMKGDMSLDEFKAFAQRFMTPDETNSYLAQYGYDYNSQGGNGGNGGGTSPVGDADAKKIADFKAKLMPQTTFNAVGGYTSLPGLNGSTASGAVKFNTYNDYVDAMLENAYGRGVLTQAELEELWKEFGLN